MFDWPTKQGRKEVAVISIALGLPILAFTLLFIQFEILAGIVCIAWLLILLYCAG
jgi:hypothetical protein